MFRPERLQLACAAIAGLAFGGLGYAQTSAPTNTLPNPYRAIEKATSTGRKSAPSA
jgi:hypothetical protein